MQSATVDIPVAISNPTAVAVDSLAIDLQEQSEFVVHYLLAKGFSNLSKAITPRALSSDMRVLATPSPSMP